MAFKHPQILYFLFALVIPIIIHLFQLRRFKKVAFTNVAFLKKIQTQSRKSATIKKWLLLFTRLFLLLFLILAFAQPYNKTLNAENNNRETVVIIDNSYSMQGKSSSGTLLSASVQDVLQNFPENKRFSLLTCDAAYWNVTLLDIRKNIQEITFTAVPFSLKALQLKATNKIKSEINYVIYSASQGLSSADLSQFTKTKNAFLISNTLVNNQNISIDSVFISSKNNDFVTLKINLKAFNYLPKNVPLTVYNGSKIAAKQTVNFTQPTAVIKIQLNNSQTNGKVSIGDSEFPFDNSYYFGINKPEKPTVLVIGANDKSAFLKKIYTSDEFVFITSTPENSVSYIEKAAVIILNEVNEINTILSEKLISALSEDKNVILIPNANLISSSVNSFLSNSANLKLVDFSKTESKITSISYQHPLYKGVFEKEISNFEYPKTATNSDIKGSFQPVLKFSNNETLLANKGGLYVFTSALNTENSNFNMSPLVVPTFYNFAKLSSTHNLTQFTIGANSKIEIPVQISKDATLKMENELYSYIPSQEIKQHNVKLLFSEIPFFDGIYNVKQNTTNLYSIGFNYNRNENKYINNLEKDINLNEISSVSQIETGIFNNQLTSFFWKILLLLTLVFISIEILIQKYMN